MPGFALPSPIAPALGGRARRLTAVGGSKRRGRVDKKQRPDVSAVEPKLETLSGLKPLPNKIAESIKLVAPARAPTRRTDKIPTGASRGTS
jgi:hypothetical protein